MNLPMNRVPCSSIEIGSGNTQPKRQRAGRGNYRVFRPFGQQHQSNYKYNHRTQRNLYNMRRQG